MTQIKKAGGYLLSRAELSIIGARGLDFRVRNGNGYCPSAMAAGIINNVPEPALHITVRVSGRGEKEIRKILRKEQPLRKQ